MMVRILERKAAGVHTFVSGTGEASDLRHRVALHASCKVLSHGKGLVTGLSGSVGWGDCVTVT